MHGSFPSFVRPACDAYPTCGSVCPLAGRGVRARCWVLGSQSSLLGAEVWGDGGQFSRGSQRPLGGQSSLEEAPQQDEERGGQGGPGWSRPLGRAGRVCGEPCWAVPDTGQGPLSRGARCTEVSAGCTCRPQGWGEAWRSPVPRGAGTRERGGGGGAGGLQCACSVAPGLGRATLAAAAAGGRGRGRECTRARPPGAWAEGSLAGEAGRRGGARRGRP